ncbi:hypothetical protein B0J12DRAFT_256870 [Macrophomina phaseolina]|uniref:DUF1754-domain-containing protein n=1 Tax=Macrophomina phaseolina TaxID=35725 RepID=A0ABQ8FZG3_9PEZI|nr:hypothetical protein B0J12DRAFT_256870 [Macrophomina phaseolina]
MPGSEYTAVSGGALKLKGGTPIDKKKKKKDKKPKPTTDADGAAAEASASASNEPTGHGDALQRALAEEDGSGRETSVDRRRDGAENEEELGRAVSVHRHKTEAERKYEERRRKRLDERLKREGVKTHKERVEELNKYLSTLSEHHDMPRIGPG